MQFFEVVDAAISDVKCVKCDLEKEFDRRVNKYTGHKARGTREVLDALHESVSALTASVMAMSKLEKALADEAET